MPIIAIESKAKKHNMKLVIEAIETPRGLVPTIKSIESLVAVMNNLLGELAKLFSNINRNIAEILASIKDLSDRVHRLEIAVKVLQDSIIDLKSRGADREVNIKRKEEVSGESEVLLKKKLLDLLED